VKGSGGMIYISNLISIGSDVQKLFGWGDFVHRQYGHLIILLLFFQNKECSLIKIANKSYEAG
jgi:hypothetical protein